MFQRYTRNMKIFDQSNENSSVLKTPISTKLRKVKMGMFTNTKAEYNNNTNKDKKSAKNTELKLKSAFIFLNYKRHEKMQNPLYL